MQQTLDGHTLELENMRGHLSKQKFFSNAELQRVRAENDAAQATLRQSSREKEEVWEQQFKIIVNKHDDEKALLRAKNENDHKIFIA